MDRVFAATLLAAVVSGVSLSSHAGPVRVSHMDTVLADHALHRKTFTFDEQSLLTLAMHADTEEQLVYDDRVDGVHDLMTQSSPANVMQLFDSRQCGCGCGAGEGQCASDSTHGMLAPQDARLSSESAFLQSFDIAFTPPASHEVVVWRNQAWSSARMNEARPEPSFSPDVPSVSLPRGFVLGLIGLISLAVVRWRFGVR